MFSQANNMKWQTRNARSSLVCKFDNFFAKSYTQPQHEFYYVMQETYCTDMKYKNMNEF